MAKSQCRVCLNDDVIMLNIFCKENKSVISTKIMQIAKVQIYPGDGLPCTICRVCVKKLNGCIDFIKLCEESDKTLRSAIITKVTESISDDIAVKVVSEKNSLKLEKQNDNLLNNDIQTVNSNISVKKKFRDDLNREDEVKLCIDKRIEKQQCFTCGKVMSSRFRLKTHLRIHTGERPFSCPHCNKNFSLAQNLKVHLRTHTGEKPLQCSICGESFAQSAGLAAHKRKHTGQMPYRCVLCPRSFRTVGHLQYHIRRHTGEKNFECDTCGKAFITRSDLKQHLLTHSGDRPHVCCVCGLRLSRSSHLKRHIQHMHNGLQPFKCKECLLTFTDKNEFDKHTKEHADTIQTKNDVIL